MTLWPVVLAGLDFGGDGGGGSEPCGGKQFSVVERRLGGSVVEKLPNNRQVDACAQTDSGEGSPPVSNPEIFAFSLRPNSLPEIAVFDIPDEKIICPNGQLTHDLPHSFVGDCHRFCDACRLEGFPIETQKAHPSVGDLELIKPRPCQTPWADSGQHEQLDKGNLERVLRLLALKNLRDLMNLALGGVPLTLSLAEGFYEFNGVTTLWEYLEFLCEGVDSTENLQTAVSSDGVLGQ